MKYPYTLPPLPYTYDALEPYIDAKTMEIHYTKHHQKYIDELNNALKDYPTLQEKSLDYLLTHLDAIPENIREAVKNNGGGHLNHSQFWLFMTPKSSKSPTGELKDNIIKSFDSLQNFQEKFNSAAKSRFGSGWAWLILNQQGNLDIVSTANQDTTLSQSAIPIMGLDVWEHAYYLKYQNRRPDYINAWWNIVNWEYIQDHYQKIK